MSEIFIRKWSEISGDRFDSEYYQQSNFVLFSKLLNNNFKKLKNIIAESSYGILPPSDCYNDENPVLFIRATELKEDLKIDFKNAFKVPKNFLLPKVTLKKDDILIAVKGATIASKKSVAFVNKDIPNAIFNGSIFRIRANTEKFIPKCLAYILDSEILKTQCKINLIANNGVDYLDKNVLNNLLIPNLSIYFQQQIINVMDNAYRQKEIKEQKAKELLDSIDNYLMQELGINLPNNNCTSLEQRIFTQRISHLSGTRFDPNYHQKYYSKLEQALKNGKYELVRLKKIINNIKNLSQPDRETIYIEIGDIDVENTLINFKSMPLSNLPHNSKICIESGDLLISKVRPNRKALAIYEKNDKAYCTSAFCVLRENGKYKKELLQNLLRLDIFNSLLVRQVTGSTYPTINDDDILNLKIPLPPLQIQEQIANEINKRRERAKKSQQEAKEILESAKKQVENMILGG